METKTFFMTSNYYPPYHVGGACIHVYQLANALAELGHEVHIVYSLDWYYLKKGNVEPKDTFINDENIVLHPIRSSLHSLTPLIAYTFGYYYPLSEKILKIINDVKPDVIHHHNITGFGPFILKAKAGKVLYTAHDCWLVCPTFSLLKNNKTSCDSPRNCSLCSICSKKPPTIWRYFNNIQKLTKNIDEIIAPSNFIKNRLVQFGISKRIEVIPNFVEIHENENPRIFKNSYILYVGRLEYNKGVSILINSFFEILNKTDYHLVIAGDGSLREEIRTMANSEKFQQRLHYLGQLDRLTLDNLYRHASAVILPSIIQESFSLVALESLLNGTPIIATKSGGIPEIVENTNAGILIDGETEDILHRSLVDILKRKELWEKIKIDPKTFSEYYSKANYIKKYLNIIYKDIAK